MLKETQNTGPDSRARPAYGPGERYSGYDLDDGIAPAEDLYTALAENVFLQEVIAFERMFSNINRGTNNEWYYDFFVLQNSEKFHTRLTSILKRLCPHELRKGIDGAGLMGENVPAFARMDFGYVAANVRGQSYPRMYTIHRIGGEGQEAFDRLLADGGVNPYIRLFLLSRLPERFETVEKRTRHEYLYDGPEPSPAEIEELRADEYITYVSGAGNVRREPLKTIPLPGWSLKDVDDCPVFGCLERLWGGLIVETGHMHRVIAPCGPSKAPETQPLACPVIFPKGRN